MNSSIKYLQDCKDSNTGNLSTSESVIMKSNDNQSNIGNENLSSQITFDNHEEIKERNNMLLPNQHSNELNQSVGSPQPDYQNPTDFIDSDDSNSSEINSEDAPEPNDDVMNQSILIEHLNYLICGTNSDSKLNDNTLNANSEEINRWSKNILEHNRNRRNCSQNKDSQRF